MPLRRAIGERRSQRRFDADPVPLAALSAILAGMAQPPQLSEPAGARAAMVLALDQFGFPAVAAR